nr:SIS domain-containing protein [Deinobacterium chartae]
MLQETREAPAVVARLLEHNAAQVQALAERLRAQPPRFVMTVARGSSDHAATFLKYVFETELGWAVGSMAPSITSVYGSRLNLEGALVIAISQSGASPDVVESVQAARDGGALTVAITNQESSRLAQTAEYVLPMRAGEEKAVAATKSYIASLVAPLQLVAALKPESELRAALEALPHGLEQTMALEAVARSRAERYRYAEAMVVLARGLHYGVAMESALKLKETSGIQAEAYSAAEFAHGPMRIVEPGYPLLVYQSRDQAAELSLETYRSLEEKGAELILIGADAELKAPVRLITPAGHPLTDPVMAAAALYLFAGHLALSRGMNPDAPPSLRKVTLTR